MVYFLICYGLILIYNLVKGKKAMHMLQQNLYNENNRYAKWLDKNLKTAYLYPDLISLVMIAGACLLNQTLISNILIGVSLVFYGFTAYLIKKREKNEQVKKPLVVTARVKRLLVTLTIVYCIPLILYFACAEYQYFVLFTLAMFTTFVYSMVLLAKILNTPVERMVYRKFYRQAQRKLKSMNHLSVVGITGSYGKTSSKNILASILNARYITRPTPRNLNTEYGLMITINNHLDKFDEVFIAEMGAYTRGEIKTLCDMVHPKYGILTRIGTAHLESFGSQENIQKTKFELIESLPSDGIAILNMDDELQTSYELKNDVEVVWIGIDRLDADVVAKNIQCSGKGSTFDILFDGEKKAYPFETKLLGKNNVYNILASVALGRKMGMTIEELQQGVRKTKQIEHRLELRDLGYMYMIDDAYNSNPVGAKAALDVLAMMDGLKVVVTPGMIELGEKQEELNREFGRQIASVADQVILIGEKITKPIQEGLKDAGYDKNKIHILNDVTKAYELIRTWKDKKDVFALFENDLPDNYNE